MNTENTPSALAKHTRGPWVVKDGVRIESHPYGPDKASYPVAHVADPTWQTHAALAAQTREANARLVASAPTLLAENAKLREALDCTLSWMKQHHPTAYENSHKARSALDTTQ